MPGERVLCAGRVRVHRRSVKYLVDANVLSEPTKPTPDPAVVAWLRRNERQIVVDPVVLGEVRFGILLLPKGRRRASLERWFDEGVQRLHCVPWDLQTGLRWAVAMTHSVENALATPSRLVDLLLPKLPRQAAGALDAVAGHDTPRARAAPAGGAHHPQAAARRLPLSPPPARRDRPRRRPHRHGRYSHADRRA